ncbi:MAG: acyl-CoA dehydrogenase family protein, partial [Burkholderiales bacterium]|nr:acyl-CoA dehydrogenase family protein [Burkholderiales bacterium]
QWHAGEPRAEKRNALLQAVIELGFADALPGTDAREAWLDAAAILRAQARGAAPVDMARLLVTGDRAGSIAYDPGRYACAAAAPALADDKASALALARALQITGAMQAALELSVQYVQDRRQFGQPLARFQAIQHSLAIAAEEIAACTTITDLALACAAREGIGAARLAALLDATAVVANRAVDVVYDVCHQVHGAIGFTREYALHRHSLDLLRWRDALVLLRGGELRAAERLGDRALAAGSVWRAVTALMKPEKTA